jgi:hypothetical protein
MKKEELYDQFAAKAVDAAARTAFEIGLQRGHEQGISGRRLFEAGTLVGFVAGLESVKGAISDGTRNGSSECARVLESYKRLGVTGEE